jgi:hypothetical protein
MRRSGAALVAVPHRSCGGWSCHDLRDDTVSRRCCSAQARLSGSPRDSLMPRALELPYECHGDSPPRWVARLNFHDRTDHPRDRQSVQHHYRPFAPILGKAAASRLSRVSNFYRLHATPMVAVRDTVLRRSAPYQGRVNQNPFGRTSGWPVDWTGQAFIIANSRPQRSKLDAG